MNTAQFFLGTLVFLPLLAAAVLALLPARYRGMIGTVVGLGITVCATFILIHVSGGEVAQLTLGGYEQPVGIALRADGIAGVFIAMTAAVGLSVSIFASLVPSATGLTYTTDGAKSSGHPGFWPLWLGAWSGLNAVYLSADLFNMYVGLELVGLTAVGLVALGGRDSWRAALRYLFVAVIGSLLFLLAVAMVVSVTGTLDIHQSAQALHNNPDAQQLVVFATLLLSLGLGLKLALAPMHHWLAPAHSVAPSAVSPILSALVIKAAVFVFLRFWFGVLGPVVLPAVTDPSHSDTGLVAGLQILGVVLAGFGVLALVLGSVRALQQTRLKPLIAYSTVTQVGYWFLFLPVILIPNLDSIGDPGVTDLGSEELITWALTGTVALILGHGLAKSAMFLVAGYFKERFGTDEIQALRGVARTYPVLVMAMALAAVGLAGLPLSIAFSGKWQLASASILAGHYWVLPVIVVATLLSAAYLLKALGPLLMHPEDQTSTQNNHPTNTIRLPWLAQSMPFVLGLATVLTGLLGAGLTDVLQVGG